MITLQDILENTDECGEQENLTTKGQYQGLLWGDISSEYYSVVTGWYTG